ncbi:hypothetical protein [Candidatus Contubernalis alkaliaceticus]|uniref:hypothetical protein n=1 Tax=Candidatus Contubernalis alkaliaceticus TaxID=338645 RepID=UPI001F4BE2B2|nr:hypothetical protein [Candidatus Contubernalis alkalaceticus]UNC92370.1 hypothetical protein HUE98_09825 [Candidatus Contubernalis alkalaceticus]
MKKIFYCFLVLMLMLSLVFFGVGCGNGGEEPVPQEDTTTEADVEETEITIEEEEEEAAGETAAAELPKYPGSAEEDEFPGIFITSDSVEDVKDFYEKNLPNYTVEEDEVMNCFVFSADGEMSVILWVGDNDTVLIEFADY